MKTMVTNRLASTLDRIDLTPQDELLYQALETELGGVDIYKVALSAVRNEDLRMEWDKYLLQTLEHIEKLRTACVVAGLDPERDTPGRQVQRVIGKALVNAIHLAKGNGDPAAAEIVAAECVTLAETKDHANWSLLTKLGLAPEDGGPRVSDSVAGEVEDEEDEHLYHSSGWARELWMQTLGLPARLPPPEEEENVHTMEEAARARAGSEAERL